MTPTSLGLSTLLNFYKRSKVPLAALEELEDEFDQTGLHDGNPLWTPRLGKTEEEIRFFNDVLMDWIWHFRDYFWLYAERNFRMPRKAAQALTDAVVAASDDLKLCGYFTNQRKHVQVENFKLYPAFKATPPRLGEVWIHFLMENGKTMYRTDVVAGEGHQVSSKLPFIQTVHIEDCPGERDTRRVVEEAAWAWIDLLKTQGIDLGVNKPQPFECKTVIDFLGVGTSPKAVAARRLKYPEGITGPPLEWDDLFGLSLRLDGPFEHWTVSDWERVG